ncbi:TetR/AcrR family transcriptional regulator [Phenylobacterium sp.]|uniref:TetR/AcrR family transcriptional regulator n=1 Tax=Phenylobacterium sp. TaxID=1871053 RepID=UPI001216DA26|nr:TetR/AcrR family transcriptional regulator [Phenylobacterium sp.]THD64379.1 MAG: TetR/AcrR family transcriptional regulator [Phenylobacterium sp.]
MRDSQAAEARPYHHGDLRRALIDAASRLLEAEGPSALSLRAVAREAGVSPAAPYHHFKDKGELLEAVAGEGWTLLDGAIAKARAEAATPADALDEIGVAYVCFARENPAIYRVMYDTARDKEAFPDGMEGNEDSAYCKVRDTFIDAGANPNEVQELELSTTAAWCSAHGLAEMANFKQFQHLKDALGGETAFFRAVFKRLGLAAIRAQD